VGATREAALLAARRLDPEVDAAQIVPTRLAVSVLYAGGPQPGALIRTWVSTPRDAASYDGRPRVERAGR